MPQWGFLDRRVCRRDIVCASVPMILTSRRVMCTGVFEQRQELMAVVWTLFDAPDASHADIARIIGTRSSPIPSPTCFAPYPLPAIPTSCVCKWTVNSPVNVRISFVLVTMWISLPVGLAR